MPLLERLSETDWSALTHAYGSAADVPDLLRALANPADASPALRAAAATEKRTLSDYVHWALGGNVYHQGSRYEVTSHVVPFLVEILRDGAIDVHSRRYLISYLHHLAVGFPEDLFPMKIDPATASRELEGTDPDEEAEREDEVFPDIWALEAYLAVERAIPSLTPLVEADDEESALETIALLSSFPRSAAETLPILRDLVRSRSDRRAGGAVLTLARLAGADALADAQRLAASDDRVVAVQAACAALLAAPRKPAEQAVALLTAPHVEIADTRSAHAGTMGKLIGRCLERLPAAYRERAVDAVAHQHRHARPGEEQSLAETLLNLAFQDESAPASAADLTAVQRRALESIRDRAPSKDAKKISANLGLLLISRGLPDSAEALTDWLEGRDPVPPKPWWRFW